MGLRPTDFEMLTPAEFWYAYMGYAVKRYQAERSEWERARWQTWILTGIQLERKDRRSLTAMFPMPWDNETDPRPASSGITMEERMERVKQMMRCYTENQS